MRISYVVCRMSLFDELDVFDMRHTLYDMRYTMYAVRYMKGII